MSKNIAGKRLIESSAGIIQSSGKIGGNFTKTINPNWIQERIKIFNKFKKD